MSPREGDARSGRALSLEQPVPEGSLALIGAVNGPEDLAERHDDYVRERMRERFGGQA